MTSPRPKRQRYTALRGVNYPDPKKLGDEKRAEPGDVLDDLPQAAIPGLLEAGVIALHEGGV